LEAFVKNIALGAVALLSAGAASPLLAADLPVKARPPVVAAANWTGCYLGVSAGVNYGHTDGFITTPQTNLGNNPQLATNPGVNFTGGFDVKPGVIVGGYGGCDYQFSNRFVIGAEVDGSYAWKSSWAKPLPGTVAAAGFGNPNDLWEISERALVTARARLGYTVTDRWLVYVTGGAAFAKVETYETITTNPTPPESWFRTHWRTGWTVGAGTEYRVGGTGWTVRGEFLYVDLGSWNTFTNMPNPTLPGGPGSDTFTNMRVNLVDYIGRVGLHYKFNWPGTAVVAKY
jgi:outer membrane immunogenic protein